MVFDTTQINHLESIKNDIRDEIKKRIDQRDKYSNPALYVDPDGQPWFRVHWSRSSSLYSRGSSGSDGDISLNKWYYLVGVYNLLDDGNFSVELFVNGKSMGLSTNSTSPLSAYQKIEIGRGEYNSNNHFTNGSIDDVIIYNRSLSSYEIRDIYNQYLTTTAPQRRFNIKRG